MVQYKILGLEDFDKKEVEVIDSLSKNYVNKIGRKFSKASFIIQAKKYEKEGKGHHYSFHVKVENPSVLVGVKEDEWDLKKCLHEVFDKLSFRLQHKYKLEGHSK